MKIPLYILEDSDFNTQGVMKSIRDVPPTHVPRMSVFKTIEGEGFHIGTPRVLARVSGCGVGCSWCFPSTSKILTTTGNKRLADVVVGDLLYTLDEDFNIVTTEVTATLTRKVDPSYLVGVHYIEDGRPRYLTCTEDHEWHVKGRGWVPAGKLRSGDIVYHVNNLKVNAKRMSEFNPIRNGIRITSVERLNTKQRASIQREYDQRTTQNDPVSVTNFTCSPYNHFLMRGVHVHNCDSKHTWNAKGARRSAQLVTVEDFCAEIERVASRVREVSITGGEPMHYIPQMHSILDILNAKGFRVSIETSGLIIDPTVFRKAYAVSLDIKTPSSGVQLTQDNIDALISCAYMYEEVQLKAVIMNQADLDFIHTHFYSLLVPSTSKVKPLVLTPCADNTKGAISPKTILETTDLCLEWNNRYNIRIIPQVHKWVDVDNEV